MRLGRNGEIIVETGFDGGSYQPRDEYRTSVFLGDMSREDMRIKAAVKDRNAREAKENMRARLMKRAEAQSRIDLQDRLQYLKQRREAQNAKQLEIARAKGYENARMSGRVDIHPWFGSPYAGFGADGEQRINPDSNIDVEIVDANIQPVAEYGINNWMEDPDSLVSRVENADESYTPGKQVVQTMVDYAQTPALSVVGMPVSSGISDAMTAVAAGTEKTIQQVVAEPAQPNLLKYGAIALAVLWVLRK